MNKVYQHGDELFVTLDATRRMRNLRTGLTIRPRGDFDKHFKYLGEMPQVGQVWIGERTGLDKTIKGFTNGRVKLSFDQLGRTHYGEVPLEVFLQNHTLRTGPTFHFATGNKDAIKAGPQDRRFIALDFSKFEEAFKSLREYCTEAEAKMWGSVGLYMAPDGTVWKLQRSYETHVFLTGRKGETRTVRLSTFEARYKALPLPGQLWAKGNRYVTVDRVEDGRVHYTGGSSGLRRFLNEYANVTNTVSRHSREEVGLPDAAKMFVSGFDVPTGAGKTVIMQQMLGRALRPAPMDKPDPVLMSVISNRPIGTVASCKRTEKGINIVFKINDNDVERVRLSIRKAQLKQELRTVARRLKELSK